MAATVTVTGSAGPGIAVTAQVFTDITAITFDCVGNTVSLFRALVPSPLIIAITSATTITVTKSGSTYTFAIS